MVGIVIGEVSMEICDQCGKDVVSKAFHIAFECEKVHGEEAFKSLAPKVSSSITELTEEQKITSTCNTIKSLDPDESCVEITWYDDPTPQHLDIPSLKKIVEDYENHRLRKG